jgi:predicted regulator of Ras-like GTPase activity (Roadblock/LC7/MglB family)
LSADLDSFDLLDLVQVIQMARRDLSLVVRAGSQTLGVLRFAQGELLWAEFGTLRGEVAFMALAAQRTGSVEELTWDGRGERNVQQPLSRLIMQAVEYRETHGNHQPPTPGSASRSRPVQPGSSSQLPPQAHDRFNGPESHPRLGNTPPPAPKVMVPEDESAPIWVREIQSASEAFSAQPTSAIPPVPAISSSSSPSQFPGSVYSTQTEPLSPSHPVSPQGPLSSLLQEEIDIQLPEPTVPLTTPNGKFTLPSHANGNRVAFQPSGGLSDDPPTVPLPSVQGGLRDYAVKRESHPQESLPSAASKQKLAEDSLPEQATTLRSSPAVTLSTPSPPPTSELLPASAPSAATIPSGEPRMSSLSILEQLAYGGFANNGRTEAASFDADVPTPFASGPADGAVLAPLTEQPPGQRVPSRLLDDAPAGQNGKSATPAPPAFSRPASFDSQAARSPVPLGAEGRQPAQQALEAFAEQVGAACIVTAVIRTDGTPVAEYKVRRGQDQELTSPAYHLAHVMQSSLRALLMGGWGDLEDTIITGSTHSVVLRRLGRAEKGLFHVAVLERSGNPGLCRVRMRNSEASILQTL